jgi:F-type H+-transporting ATPase subunit b
MATSTTATTHAPGGPPPFPPFQRETFASQVVWLAISFVILYLLMSRIALPRVAAILSDRRARIAGDLAVAQEARQRSEAVVAGYEKSLSDARSRAQTIAGETREAFVRSADENRKELESKLNAELAVAEQSIAATKASAMANVREVASDSAVAIVERLIGVTPQRPEVAEAVARVLAR